MVVLMNNPSCGLFRILQSSIWRFNQTDVHPKEFSQIWLDMKVQNFNLQFRFLASWNQILKTSDY